MQSPEAVVESFHAAWIEGDIERAMQHVAEDAVYALHLSDELLPFAGVTKGRLAIAEALAQVRRVFEYLVYRPHTIVVEGATVRMRVEHIYRHRAS
ncbi:nuclear transport factor 2 family protein, partial [Salmonella sp. s50237]|uniref:nuclear transport factor 2 family protein n=1 Tax=Salmonella sp. s50237 TaxID=3159649 RepID=UPI0039808697